MNSSNTSYREIGKTRLSKDVFSSIAQWVAARKSNKSTVKLDRGFMRDSDKVTFKFDSSKGKQASKHELFENKQNGTGSHQYLTV